MKDLLEFIPNTIAEVGLAAFIISQVFMVGMLVCNVFGFFCKVRKNVILWIIAGQVLLVPAFALLRFPLTSFLLIAFALISMPIVYFIYHWEKPRQKKILIPLIVIMSTLGLGMFIANFWLEELGSWQFYVLQAQLIFSISAYCLLPFHNLGHKSIKWIEKCFSLQNNYLNGNLIGVIRLTIEIVVGIGFFISYPFRNKDYKRHHTQWIIQKENKRIKEEKI